MKTKKMNTENLDWERVQWADPRDPRTTSDPCKGHHVIEPFGKGSKSGVNGHALWLSCAQCRLRLAYVPKVGAPATSRSAGPLATDVQETLGKMPPNEMDPRKLSTQAIGLDAAEQSTLKHLEKIQAKKKALLKKTPEPNMTGVETDPALAKKSTKRDNAKPVEAQEKDLEGWVPVSGP